MLLHGWVCQIHPLYLFLGLGCSFVFFVCRTQCAFQVNWAAELAAGVSVVMLLVVVVVVIVVLLL